MAIYHANIKNFSSGKGESATAAAAYRAGIDILDTRTRIHHKYSRRGGVISFHMLAPAGVPAWCNDPAVFFDACERWESRANAMVARELEVALPAELDADQRRRLALALGQLLVDRYQVVVLAALHAPTAKGDQRNFHVHLLMSSRQVGPEGLGARAGAEFDARKGRGAEEIRVVRALVSSTINNALEAAGMSQTVDHRTLKAQWLEAHALGDFAKAKLLDRVPTRHTGKAITAALRRSTLDPLLAKVGITLPPADQAMGEAEAIFAKQGRLVATPKAVGHEAARTDRVREQAAQTGRADPKPSHSIGPRLQLSRLMRIGRSQGKDAEVLNAEAKLIEEWLATQQYIARSALETLHSIPGIRVEPQFEKAMQTASRNRIGVYGRKPMFLEDSELLTAAMTRYADAIVHPHLMQENLRRGQAELSQVELNGTAAAYAHLSSATKALAKARAGVSKAAQVLAERRTNEARAEMVAATEAMERDYYITPLDRVETCPPHPYTAGLGGERKSDSNRAQLKPRQRPSV